MKYKVGELYKFVNKKESVLYTNTLFFISNDETFSKGTLTFISSYKEHKLLGQLFIYLGESIMEGFSCYQFLYKNEYYYCFRSSNCMIEYID